MRVVFPDGIPKGVAIGCIVPLCGQPATDQYDFADGPPVFCCRRHGHDFGKFLTARGLLYERVPLPERR